VQLLSLFLESRVDEHLASKQSSLRQNLRNMDWGFASLNLLSRLIILKFGTRRGNRGRSPRSRHEHHGRPDDHDLLVRTDNGIIVL